MGPRESRNARNFASAQSAWDNATPEDVYGPDEPEPEEVEEEAETEDKP
jgi:hypothetical protein